MVATKPRTFKSFNRSMVFSAESRPYPISAEALERLERCAVPCDVKFGEFFVSIVIGIILFHVFLKEAGAALAAWLWVCRCLQMFASSSKIWSCSIRPFCEGWRLSFAWREEWTIAYLGTTMDSFSNGSCHQPPMSCCRLLLTRWGTRIWWGTSFATFAKAL